MSATAVQAAAISHADRLLTIDERERAGALDAATAQAYRRSELQTLAAAVTAAASHVDPVETARKREVQDRALRASAARLAPALRAQVARVESAPDRVALREAQEALDAVTREAAALRAEMAADASADSAPLPQYGTLAWDKIFDPEAYARKSAELEKIKRLHAQYNW